jgi:ABC-type multidrug transport system ATPase subunit
VTAVIAPQRTREVSAAGPAPIALVSQAVRRYPGGRSVGPIDIEVGSGEILALMGSNGAGKSTLLRLLASADRPDSGRLTWWGDRNPRRARRRMGYAADEPVEETTLSLRQSTYFWCRQWVSDPGRARQLTAETLADLGLADRADEPVGTLSYGLRRRLALAQALAHRPALALFDEPSAGLDPDGAAVVAAALRARAQAGQTTVVASNDPEFVAAVADRVAMLHQGRCLRVAPLHTLLAEVPRRRIVELRVGEPAAEPDAAAGGVGAGPNLPGAGPRRPGGDAAREGEAGRAQAALTVAVAERVGSLAGVRLVSAADGLVVAELEEDAALSQLVAAADSVGTGVRSLEVRRPDLRECFHALVGRDGEGVGAGGEGAGAGGGRAGAGGEGARAGAPAGAKGALRRRADR